MTLAGDDLTNHFKTNFALHYHHNYSMTELDNMVPFEREIYIILLQQQMAKESEERRQRAQQAKYG